MCELCFTLDMDEFRKKIKVQIRPLSPNSANATGTIEDIRASVEGLRLSPTATVSSIIDCSHSVTASYC